MSALIVPEITPKEGQYQKGYWLKKCPEQESVAILWESQAWTWLCSLSWQVFNKACLKLGSKTVVVVLVLAGKINREPDTGAEAASR